MINGIDSSNRIFTEIRQLRMRPLPDDDRILDRSSFSTEWKTDAYLQDFYTAVQDNAMKMVLASLPNIVARIGRVSKVLDFGAGPTIHVAASFRNSASEIYLADFLPQNRKELVRWREGISNFDWSVPLKMILTQEGNPWDNLENMIALTRNKVRGVFYCNCLTSPSVEVSPRLQNNFDVIVTIFCVEYCCNSLDEYRMAIKNIAEQIKPGGYIVMGGILEETWCAFGGRTFTCLYVTEENLFDALRAAGLRIENDRKCVFYEIDGMYMVCAKKVEDMEASDS